MKRSSEASPCVELECGGAAVVQHPRELAAVHERQEALRRPERDRRGAGPRALEADLAEVQVAGTEIGIGRVVSVVPADGGIAEDHTAAAVGLQAVLVRVDDDRIDLGEAVIGRACFGRQVVGEHVVAAIGAIGMQAESVAAAKCQDLPQRVDRADGGRTERRDNGADAAGLQALFERRDVDAAAVVRGHAFEGQLQHGAHATVRVMRLRGGNDSRTGCQLPGDPERLEVRHGPAARQVAEVRLPAEHARDVGDRFLLHGRTRAAAVERVIVRVDPHRERIGEARDRMRRLQHLAGVLRVEVGVVVAHAIRDFEQDLAQGRRIGRRVVPRRERVETLLHARERVMEQEQRVRIELAGHAAPIV